MRKLLRRLRWFISVGFPEEWAWVRRWRGGHWELVDFDRLWTPFRGPRWLEFDRCSRDYLGYVSKAVVRCEHHPEA